MRRALLCVATVVAISFAPPGMNAHAGESGGTQSPFVLGAGSRVQAMGRAGVAVDPDATALVWNPARLTALDRTELTLYRNQLFEDGIGYHAAFVAHPTLDNGTFSIGYLRLDVDGLERRDERNQLLGSFGNAESNLLLGYGRRITGNFAVGTALRLAQQSVDEARDTGVGFDLGAVLDHPLADGRHVLSAGLNVQNLIEPRLRLNEEEVPDPRSWKLGAAYRGQHPGGRIAWVLATDADLPRETATRWGVGAELSLDQRFALRAGSDAGHLTLGFGVEVHGVCVDYALRTDDDLSRNDRFTIAVGFGSTVSDRRVSRQVARERAVANQLEERLAAREGEELERARQEARAAADAGDWDEAVRLHRRVATLDPHDQQAAAEIDAALREASLRDAFAELGEGEAARAAASFQSTLSRWPGLSAAEDGLAQARQQLQESADRERQLGSLLKDALARFADGELRAAEQSLGELLRLDPENELGRELFDRARGARFARGQRELDRARALAGRSQFEDALAALGLAQRDLPGDEAMRELALQWSSARDEAVRRAQVVAVAAPQASSPAPPQRAALSADKRAELERRFRQGLSAFQAGDFESAIRSWRAVWVEVPGFESVGDYLVKAYLFEGIALYSQGHYDLAIERCQRVLEIEPTNAKAKRYLDRIREEKSEIEALGEAGRAR